MKPIPFGFSSSLSLPRTVRKYTKSKSFIRLCRFFAESADKSDPKLLQKTKEEVEALQQAEIRRLIPHSYSPPLFTKANEPRFIERMKHMDLMLAKERKVVHPRTVLENSQIPILLVLLLALIFYFWNTIPYPIIFKPFTLSEYFFRQPGRYWHTPFSSSVSIKSRDDMAVYFPLAAYSLYRLTWEFNSKMFIIGVLVNVAVTTSTILATEKATLNPGELMMPKTNGGSTALFFAFALLGLNPSRRVYNLTVLPFALICFAALGYDFLKQLDAKELTRETRTAHFAAAAAGFAFGTVIRRKGWAMDLI
jgi:hypothetical protein